MDMLFISALLNIRALQYPLFWEISDLDNPWIKTNWKRLCFVSLGITNGKKGSI